MSKYDHVRRARAAGQAGDHHCHWPGCTRLVPPASWGCTPHWFALPQALRSAIWRAYEQGQEIDKRPGEAYVKAVKAAHDWVMAEGKDVKQGGLL